MEILQGVRPRASTFSRKGPTQRGFSLPLGTEPLARGAFAPLAYRLGQAWVTGTLELFPPGGTVETLAIRRGYLATDDRDPLGRQAGRHLARLASVADLRYRFRPGAPAEQVEDYRGPRSSHLSVWARTHLETQLDTGRAQAMVGELAGARLVLVRRNAPDSSLCDEVDRRILAAMTPSRRLHELWPLSRTSRFRLLAFLHFLRSVGALRLLDRSRAHPGAPAPQGTSPDMADARRMLGVSADAGPEAIRRAYYRRARALHPDLHPDASATRRRLLERELAALTGAYERATGRNRP